jgi:hypothetical protein
VRSAAGVVAENAGASRAHWNGIYPPPVSSVNRCNGMLDRRMLHPYAVLYKAVGSLEYNAFRLRVRGLGSCSVNLSQCSTILCNRRSAA